MREIDVQIAQVGRPLAIHCCIQSSILIRHAEWLWLPSQTAWNFPSLWYISCLLNQCRHHNIIKDAACRQFTNASCAIWALWAIMPVQCVCKLPRIYSGEQKNQPVWTSDYIWHSRVVYHEYWQLHSLGYWYDLVWASQCSHYMWREGSFEVKIGDAWETVHVLAFGHGYCLETLAQLFAE